MATKCDFSLVQPTGLSNGSYADVDEVRLNCLALCLRYHCFIAHIALISCL